VDAYSPEATLAQMTCIISGVMVILIFSARCMASLLAPSYGDITSYLTARKFLFCSYTKKGRPERPPSAEELAQNETA
jgi:hypothetical protein